MYQAYLITNKLTNQQYVGIAKRDYLKRFRDHWNEAKSGKSNSKLHLDMIKYGLDNFRVELLLSDIPEEPDSIHQEIERLYIKEYDTFYLDKSDGYNMTRGGNGTVGYKFTESDLAKMSKAQKGVPKVLTEEQREARRIRMLKENRHFKQEWKDAIREKRLGKYTGLDNPFYGKHHSNETKQIIREANSEGAVLQIDDNGNIVNEFFNLADAGRWAAENASKADYTTCSSRISEVCKDARGICKAYGYHWKKKEGQSTNCSLEDELPDEAQSIL